MMVMKKLKMGLLLMIPKIIHIRVVNYLWLLV